MSKPKQGKVVLLTEYDPPKPAYVIELLSTQFTAQHMDGTNALTFRFYKDEDVTWEQGEDA